MTLDVAAVLSCPGNPVDASRAQVLGGGGVGVHTHRYKRDGREEQDRTWQESKQVRRPA